MVNKEATAGKSEKRERFEKVASARVQKVIHMLGLLGNCSNTNNYEYDIKDVDLMFNEIGKAVRESKSAYTSVLSKGSKTSFSFEER